MKKLKHRLMRTLVMPITFYFGYNEGIAIHILYFDNGRKARSLLSLEYDRKNERFCFDVLFLGIKLP